MNLINDFENSIISLENENAISTYKEIISSKGVSRGGRDAP